MARQSKLMGELYSEIPASYATHKKRASLFKLAYLLKKFGFEL